VLNSLVEFLTTIGCAEYLDQPRGHKLHRPSQTPASGMVDVTACEDLAAKVLPFGCSETRLMHFAGTITKNWHPVLNRVGFATLVRRDFCIQVNLLVASVTLEA